MTETEQRILDELSSSLQNGKVYSDIELAVQSEAPSLMPYVLGSLFGKHVIVSCWQVLLRCN